MHRIENHCVDCQLPCIGNQCPLRKVEVIICDECGAYADYHIEGNDFCEDCAKEYLDDQWNGMTVSEKTQALNIYSIRLK